MRFLILIFSLISIGGVALANDASQAPLVAIGNGELITRQNAPKVAADEVTNAIISQHTGTQPGDAAVAAAGNATANQIAPNTTPAAPASPAAAPAAPTAAASASPASPPAPVSKLWPRDTVPIFMTSCTRLHSELFIPCRCIIDKLMAQMQHDEFMRLSDGSLIDSDPRFLAIRDQCIAVPKQRQ